MTQQERETALHDMAVFMTIIEVALAQIQELLAEMAKAEGVCQS